MQALPKDARGFVEGIVNYLKKEKRGTGDAAMPKVQHLLSRVTATARREREATVETAVVLSEPEKQKLSSVLAKLMGHDIDLTCVVNPKLIGGVRIRIADWVVDTSFASQLSNIAQLVTE